jgi:hypothetical protein
MRDWLLRWRQPDSEQPHYTEAQTGKFALAAKAGPGLLSNNSEVLALGWGATLWVTIGPSFVFM